MGANRRKSFDKGSSFPSKGGRRGSIAGGHASSPSYFSLATISKKPRPRPWASKPSDTQPPSVCEQAASHWPHSSHASLPLDLMAPSRRYRNLVSAGGQGAPPSRASAQPSEASVPGPVLPIRLAPPCPPPAVLGSAIVPVTSARLDAKGAVVHVPRTAPSRRSPQRSPVGCVRGPVHVHEVPLPVMLPSSVSASAPEDGSTSFYDATEAGSSRQGPFTYSASYYGERDGQLGVLSKRRVMPTRSGSSTVCSAVPAASSLSRPLPPSTSTGPLPPPSGSLDEPSIESVGGASHGTRESKRLVVVCPSACASVASQGGKAAAPPPPTSATAGPSLSTSESEWEGGLGGWRGLGQARWVYGHRALRGHKLAGSLHSLHHTHTEVESGVCSEEEESSLGSHDDTEAHTDEGPEEAMPFLINNAVLGWKLTTPRRKRRLERLWEELGEPDQRKPLPIIITHAPPLRSALPAARRLPPPPLTIDMPLRPSTSPLRWRGPQGHKQEMQRADTMLQMRVSPSHRPASLNQPHSPTYSTTTPHGHGSAHAQQEWDGWAGEGSGVLDSLHLQLPQSVSPHAPTTPAAVPRTPGTAAGAFGEDEPYLQYLRAKNNPDQALSAPSTQQEPPPEPSPKRQWTKLLLKPSTRSPPKHVVTIASVPDSAASVDDSAASVVESVAGDEASINNTPPDVQAEVIEKEGPLEAIESEQPTMTETQVVVEAETVES